MSSLNRHINTVHEGHKYHKCENCGKSFSQAENLRRHIITVHKGKKDYNCDTCSKSFSCIDDLKNHINTIHEGRYQNCNKFFSKVDNLKIILNKIHKSAMLDKNQQDLDLTSSFNNDDNTNIVEEFKCELCHSQFMTEKSLKIHTTQCAKSQKTPENKSTTQSSGEEFLLQLIVAPPSPKRIVPQITKPQMLAQQFNIPKHQPQIYHHQNQMPQLHRIPKRHQPPSPVSQKSSLPPPLTRIPQNHEYSTQFVPRMMSQQFKIAQQPQNYFQNQIPQLHQIPKKHQMHQLPPVCQKSSMPPVTCYNCKFSFASQIMLKRHICYENFKQSYAKSNKSVHKHGNDEDPPQIVVRGPY